MDATVGTNQSSDGERGSDEKSVFTALRAPGPSVAKDDYKLGGGRENGGNYLLRAVIGAVEMPKIERHPHKVGNSARLHLLHDRGPVMLGRPRADP